MSDKLDEYVDGVFAPYEGAKSIIELKGDLLADLHGGSVSSKPRARMTRRPSS